MKSSLTPKLLVIWETIPSNLKRLIYFSQVLSIISGGLELITLGSILPFLTAISEPQKMLANSYVQQLLNLFPFIDENNFLLITTIFFVATTVLAASARLLGIWLNENLSARIGTELSCKAYKSILSQSYESHLNVNSSSYISSVTTYISRTVASVRNILLISSSTAVALGITAALLLASWKISFFIFGSISIIYMVIGSYSKGIFERNSHKLANATQKTIQSLQEGLGSIRDIIMGGYQDVYTKMYKSADQDLRYYTASNQIMAALPKPLLEAAGITLLAAVGYCATAINSASPNENSNIIPILGAFALASQKLLPAVQQIYASWSFVRSCSADLEAVSSILTQCSLPYQAKPMANLDFNESVKLRDLTYVYPTSLSPTLSNVSLNLYKGDCIGLIGKTGSGKSTLVDVLMGLLKPSKGQILVDDVDVYLADKSGNLPNFRSLISHVPQSIYLFDGSVASNIAFGQSPQNIDYTKLERAAKIAEIHDLINSLESKYQTQVGESGVRLSGGQRQRIGIARALYHSSEILILDEATSALDSHTEAKVIENIHTYLPSCTILMIAHRLSTLQNCNRIYKLCDNRLVELPSIPQQ